MAIEIIEKQRAIKVDRRSVQRLVKKILQDHLHGDSDLSIVFARDGFVRALNVAYRKIDRPTDVLAFAMRDVVAKPDWVELEGPETVLGDVVISVDRARVQAGRFRRTIDREVLKLVAHGVLHLLGYDHEYADDRREMRRLENRYVRAAFEAGRRGEPSTGRARNDRRARSSGRRRRTGPGRGPGGKASS